VNSLREKSLPTKPRPRPRSAFTQVNTRPRDAEGNEKYSYAKNGRCYAAVNQHEAGQYQQQVGPELLASALGNFSAIDRYRFVEGRLFAGRRDGSLPAGRHAHGIPYIARPIGVRIHGSDSKREGRIKESYEQNSGSQFL
jgi:hypothetical protein